MRVLLVFIIVLMITFGSCQRTVMIYYNDTSSYDDGDIWGSNLPMFFEKKSDIKIVVNETTSKKVLKELNRIRKNIFLRGDKVSYIKLFENYTVVKDDHHFYDYAFVLNKKDTLYVNMALGVWRYDHQKLKIESSVEAFLREEGILSQE